MPTTRVPIPKNAHRLVVATARRLKGPDDEDGVLWSRSPESLDVRVTRGNVARALAIIDSVLKKAETSGVTVSISEDYRNRTILALGGQSFALVLREAFRHVPRRDRNWFDLEPTGQFLLLLENDLGHAVARFPDGKRRKVEEKINDFVAAIHYQARKRREQLEGFERERLARAAERARLAAEERRKEEERQPRVALHEEVARHRQAEALRRYLAEVRRAAAGAGVTVDVGTALGAWLTWAEAQAEALDPVKPRLLAQGAGP